MSGSDQSSQIETIVKNLPGQPGVYKMLDSRGEVIYVGKAKNLRSRAASYFQPAGDLTASRGPKIAEMLSKTKTVGSYHGCAMYGHVIAYNDPFPYCNIRVDNGVFSYFCVLF